MNKIEQQIDELRRMAKGQLEAIDCNFCDDELADTMQALYEVAKAAEAYNFTTGKGAQNLIEALDNLRELNDG